MSLYNLDENSLKLMQSIVEEFKNRNISFEELLRNRDKLEEELTVIQENKVIDFGDVSVKAASHLLTLYSRKL